MRIIFKILILVNCLASNLISQTLIFAHRGFSGKFLENSLEAFQEAVELGVDGVELDVWVCKTGELVVFHDRDLERVSNGKGKIVDKTFQEIRSLKLSNGQTIPTLQEVLNKINRKCRVNIELKGPDAAKPTAKVIKNFISNYGWSKNDFIVTSFDHPELKKFHKIIPTISFGPLQDGLMLDYPQYAKKMGASCIFLNFEYVSPKLIKQAHKLGLKVLVYTVNDAQEMLLMKKIGVDGIISNFPNLF